MDENKLNSDKNKTLDDIIFKDIFDQRSKVCAQKECFLYNKYILNINYNDIILPRILSLNCDFGSFEKLIEHKQKINDLFIEILFINNSNYELVGIIFHKNNNHYLSLAKNGNSIFS